MRLAERETKRRGLAGDLARKRRFMKQLAAAWHVITVSDCFRSWKGYVVIMISHFRRPPCFDSKKLVSRFYCRKKENIPTRARFSNKQKKSTQRASMKALQLERTLSISRLRRPPPPPVTSLLTSPKKEPKRRRLGLLWIPTRCRSSFELNSRPSR
jgi:hypothetical protein